MARIVCFIALSSLLAVASCRSGGPPAAVEPPGTRRVTAEGLVIEDQRIGTGAPCPAGAIAEVNFVGRFADGRIFDSSEKRRRSLVLDLSSPGVIRGLREGIPGMRAGGRRVVTIPWSMAYGEHGRDPIPPKTDLVFEIELAGWSARE